MLSAIVFLVSMPAVAEDDSSLTELQAKMLRLISSPDKDKFTEVTENLKNKCQQQGDERQFYIAWGNQSTYEATHQNYPAAESIANEIDAYARAQTSCV